MLSFAGCVFTLVMGSFLGYHIYLVLCVCLLLPLRQTKTPNIKTHLSFFLSSLSLPFPQHNSTNQTTLEHISPFHLLRHLPPLPPSRLSSPPQEHQLAFSQRRAVRTAHARLRLYDVGWRRNTAQVFGTSTGPSSNSSSSTKRRWFAASAARLVWGGNSCGTGTQFPRNPHAEDVLVDLAAELVRLENNDRY
jgi:palmitoyltransferase